MVMKDMIRLCNERLFTKKRQLLPPSAKFVPANSLNIIRSLNPHTLRKTLPPSVFRSLTFARSYCALTMTGIIQ